MTAALEDTFLPEWGNKEEIVKTKYEVILKGTRTGKGNKRKN